MVWQGDSPEPGLSLLSPLLYPASVYQGINYLAKGKESQWLVSRSLSAGNENIRKPGKVKMS